MFALLQNDFKAIQNFVSPIYKVIYFNKNNVFIRRIILRLRLKRQFTSKSVFLDSSIHSFHKKKTPPNGHFPAFHYLCAMNYLELFGTLIGLVYLALEYRASIYLWPVSIIMPAIYLVVYYQAGLYADFGINVYYLLASVYGWMAWSWKKKETDAAQPAAELSITSMPRKVYLPLTAVFVVCWLAIAWILIKWTDSNVPWTDSFTTALSVVGMWMLARKYVEQWGVWMVVDWVCCGLYVYKGLYFTAVLYGVYAVVAIFGWRRWRSAMKTESQIENE